MLTFTTLPMKRHSDDPAVQAVLIYRGKAYLSAGIPSSSEQREKAAETGIHTMELPRGSGRNPAERLLGSEKLLLSNCPGKQTVRSLPQVVIAFTPEDFAITLF